MPVYKMEGESFVTALALERADEKEFQGVVAYRLWGTKAKIIQATDLMQNLFANFKITTLGNAEYIGQTAEGDIYELIVLREVERWKTLQKCKRKLKAWASWLSSLF